MANVRFRKMRRRGMVALLALLVGNTAVVEEPRQHPVQCPTECGDVTRFGDTFDWQHHGPLEFLLALQRGAERAQASGGFPFYTVHGSHRGWLLESDLPQLVNLIDSPTPCLAVVSSNSSVLPSSLSTVGVEAIFLIEGYRTGRYPPAITSAHRQGDAAEIRQWWAETQNGRSGT